MGAASSSSWLLNAWRNCLGISARRASVVSLLEMTTRSSITKVSAVSVSLPKFFAYRVPRAVAA